MCSFWRFRPIFRVFANSAAIKKTFFPKHLSARIILVLDAIFVPYSTFLGLLSLELSLREEPVTQPFTYLDTQRISLRIEG